MFYMCALDSPQKLPGFAFTWQRECSIPSFQIFANHSQLHGVSGANKVIDLGAYVFDFLA